MKGQVMGKESARVGVSPEIPIRIGVSACLLGEKVRYDGGHKHDRYLTETLGPYIEWVPVCPEVELGLGTPRDTMRLELVEGAIRMIMTRSGRDLTASMRAYARSRVAKLAGEELCGYILKSDSPSCGLARVRIHDPCGKSTTTGRGLFADALIERFPYLPVEEEGRLCDPRLRENWIERIFAYRRLQSLWNSRWRIRGLREFHAAHKLILLTHAPAAYQRLGRLAAQAGAMSSQELRRRYHGEFMEALSIPATRGRHANVLQHMAGYFKRQLDDESRQELAALVEDYRKGEVPWIVPVTLISHYVRLFEISYLAGQAYLNPDPRELALRFHV
jgi:uncharacterized protein YbgA (DUF1722 family)/uncharacterized protein YbbK (DUF523 family)